jgi:ketosteroid isomerase-like protein
MPSNLEIVFGDWLDALRRGDIDRIASRLAPDIVHEGVRPELCCNGRDAVIARLRKQAAHPPAVTALELVEVGPHVVLSVRAATIGVPVERDSSEPRGQATIVFTLEDGCIVHMRDYPSRATALEAVGPERSQVWI